MSPEALAQTKAPIRDPKTLFQGVTVRPPQPKELQREALHKEIQDKGMRNPQAVFGARALAQPGQHLARPHELDLEPTQPQEPIILESLASVMNPEPPVVNFVDDTDTSEDAPA